MKIINYLGGALISASLILPSVVSAQNYPQKSNLPTIYIETENHQAINSKETYLRATLRYVDADGEKFYDALGIRGRGNSTWKLAKKPYRIKFDKKQEFLGSDHAKAKSWTLLANYADKSLMRNALAAHIGAFAGQPFTAAAQFVDLVLNGNYVGNYQVSDQVEVRAKRVDIVEQEDPMTDDSNITGGYLLEIDGFADSEPCKFTTSRGVKITVKSPDDEIIDSRQVNYIKNYIQSFENALFSTDFTNPETGYRQYVDENTLLSWFVVSEMTANPDAFWSTYIYKNQDDPKIYWGPLWDYDIAFNNCKRKGDMTRRMVLQDGFGEDLTGVWLRRMWEDPWFVNAVNEKWKSMVENGAEEHMLNFIDEKESELSVSQTLDGKLWPINKRVYDEYVVFSTYSATVDFLRKFIRERVAYLTEIFEKEAAGAVPTPPFEIEEDYYYRIHNTNTMKCADLTKDGKALCGNTYVTDTPSQQWNIKDLGNGFCMITNRATGQAITDNAPLVNGNYQRNEQLAVSEPDAGNLRQQWQIVPLPTGGSYTIANHATGLAWNNSGGSSNDGNPWISWDNDSNNPNKPNRHWRIIRDELKDNSGVGELNTYTTDYIVTYSPSESMIRFMSCADTLPEGTYSIIDINGTTVISGQITGQIDISALSKGMYVLMWETEGQYTSRKLVKP
ncbi:MAG: CotH kinase family protein [Muribaculaceae bacterium]|nr:CotH kinase family protein [Muribaculaceae bacterium]